MKSLYTISGAMAFATLLLVPNARAEETLTFDAALQTALKGNPALVSAREAHNAATAKANQSYAGYLPQANASIGYNRATANSRPGGSNVATLIPGYQAPGETDENTGTYNAQVSVSQLIYDFGKTGGAYDAAHAEANATSSDALLTAQAVVMNTTQAFFSVLANQEGLQAAREAKRQMEQHLTLADGQVTAGVRPMIDVTRAKVDLANANLTLIRATNQLAIAKSTLNALMGLTADAPTYHVEKPQLSRGLPGVSMADAVAAALAQRPDYQALKLRKEALYGTVRTVRAGYFPALAAAGSLNYVATDFERQNIVHNWTVGATATWNFFSGFGTTHALDEVDARQRAMEAQLLSLEIQVRNDVETAYLALNEAYERLAPTEAALEASKETLALAEARYQAGAGSIVEVTDAQALFTQAQTNAIQADFDLQVARARLQKAMGEISVQEK